MILRWLKLQRPVKHAEKALEYIETVLAIVQKRIATHSEPEMYSWLIPEIEYVKSVLSDANANRSKLHEIDFGTAGQAGETLEMGDPELFEALVGVSYIADQIDDGLEIEVEELEDSIKVLASFKNKP